MFTSLLRLADKLRISRKISIDIFEQSNAWPLDLNNAFEKHAYRDLNSDEIEQLQSFQRFYEEFENWSAGSPQVFLKIHRCLNKYEYVRCLIKNTEVLVNSLQTIWTSFLQDYSKLIEDNRGNKHSEQIDKLYKIKLKL